MHPVGLPEGGNRLLAVGYPKHSSPCLCRIPEGFLIIAHGAAPEVQAVGDDKKKLSHGVAA